MGPEGKPTGRLKKIQRDPREETPGPRVASGDFSKQVRSSRFASAHHGSQAANGVEHLSPGLPQHALGQFAATHAKKTYAVTRNTDLARGPFASCNREKSPGLAKCNISAPDRNRQPRSALLEAHDHERERCDEEDDPQQQRPTRHPSL